MRAAEAWREGKDGMRRLVIDLDDTLTVHGVAADYADAPAREDVVARLREYHAAGFEIVIHTARNMRTHKGNVGRINVHTLPGVMAWLDRHAVPYDEIIVGKPWCGRDGFYVDDRAVRPDEFVRLAPVEIRALLKMAPATDDGTA